MRAIGMITTGVRAVAGAAAAVLLAGSASDVSRYLRMRKM
jgi:hypothetical protein